MARPAVDVVVPFRGSQIALDGLLRDLGALVLGPADTLVVADNSPRPGRRSRAELPHPAGRSNTSPEGPRIVTAAGQATPAYARNRGAEAGANEWLVFVDADTVPAPGLLDAYFDPPPDPATALLAGGIRDEAVPWAAGLLPRYAYVSGAMSQENTLGYVGWPFPQTANAACRREAFESVGGFTEGIRAAEDADLTFRLRRVGWSLERREAATVVHRSRGTVRGFVAQKAGHGAGAAWLNREHPGSFPPRRRPGLTWWGVRRVVTGVARGLRERDRDEALYGLLEPVEQLAYEFGRSLPNERPLPPGARWGQVVRALERL